MFLFWISAWRFLERNSLLHIAHVVICLKFRQHALQQDCSSHRLFEDESHPDAKSRRGRLFFPKSGGGVGKMGPADWLNNKLSPALRMFHGSCYEGYKGRKYIRKIKRGSERQKCRQVTFMHRGRRGRGYCGREGADGVDKGN